MNRSLVRAAGRAALLLLLLGTAGIQAQSYPERPVRIFVGFSPGGSSDIVARLVAQHLTPLLGQPVVVENKPGASGMLAVDAVAKAAPDGYSLLLATAGNPVMAAIMRKLPFEPVKDFAWISTITTYPFVIATSPQSRFKSLADVISAAKAAPGTISYSSVGFGTAHHLLGEWFSAETGISLLHVPFKGGSATITEVLAGRIDIMFETMTATMAHIKSGKLRALGVTTRETTSFLAGVPTVAQTVPGLVFQSWLGIAGPAALPPAVVERLVRDLHRVLGEPEVQKRLAELGGAAAPIRPDTMRAQVESEIKRWNQLVDSRRIERQ